MRGKKTGGRVKGSVDLRPRRNARATSVPTLVATTVTATVATAAGGAPPDGDLSFATRTRTRSATDPALRKYRMQRVDALVAYENNPRTHSPAQIDLIAKMITEYGFTNPVLVDGKRGIIAGHGRVLAAQKLGMDAVPTLELSHLNAAQRRAYVIADNASALKAGWDNDLLSLELGELRLDGFDLSLTGFDGPELLNLLGDESSGGLTDPDDVPPLAAPVSVLGDVWTLGRHRLVCGDSTTAEAVDAALAGVKPHLMVTDPPYGDEYDANWRNERMRQDGSPVGGRAVGKVMNDDRADWTPAWALFPGDVAYVWCASLHNHEVAVNLLASGFALRSLIIWAKSNFAIGRGHYHWQHEPCWYAVREGATGHWAGDRTQSTLWQIDKPQKSETGHSTQKPVECMKRPIENNSSAGQAVYDPFVGSGTTIIAAEMTGRACHAIELSPAYVDVAIRRWQAFAGQEATHADGRTFAAIEAARGVVAKPVRVRPPRVKVAA
jgi:DNA modification methylase